MIVRHTPVDGSLWLWCPGCDDAHRIVVNRGDAWTWDGDAERPTIAPSLLVTSGPGNPVCHSFVRAGRWEFLGDSTHELAGQTVDVVELPDWIAT